MILHIVNKSPFEKSSLASCLRLSQPGSPVLLIEDGVYGALAGINNGLLPETANAERNVYALEPDLALRGIEHHRLLDYVKVIGYSDFVALTVEASAVQSWL